MIRFFNHRKNMNKTTVASHIQSAIAKMELTIARTQKYKVSLFKTDYLEN